MAKIANYRYFKLGEKATSFVDPQLNISIAAPGVLAIDTRMLRAINMDFFNKRKHAGHILEIQKPEFEAVKEELRTVLEYVPKQKTIKPEPKKEEAEEE